MFSRVDFGRDAYIFEKRYGVNAKYLWNGKIITSWDINKKATKMQVIPDNVFRRLGR
jgi:hypothetical protein